MMVKLLRQLKSKVIGLHPRRRLNFNDCGVFNLIDIGSIGGLPAPWDANANKIKILLNFDPNESIKKSKNYMTYNTAVWDSECVRPFYVYKGFNATGSSLFKQNYQYVKDHFDELKFRGPERLAKTWWDRSQLVETREIRCQPLDEIISAVHPGTQFHFLKVDAQGAELNILKGASALLSGSCVGLHLELFALPLYQDIPLLGEVVDYLSRYGFRLVKKFPAHGTFDSQHDCLFLKPGGDKSLYKQICDIYKIDSKSFS